jgi:hypothetical protein
VAAAGSPSALGAVLVLAGAAIAPTYAAVHAGPSRAFVLAGAAGVIALLATLLRSRTLPGREAAVVPVAVPAG